jgi:NADH:ubiquinone oxidoreductase subunit E
MEKFGTELGVRVDETTADQLFTLKSVRCLGCCGLAPVATVGSETHGRLTATEVPRVIQQYREARRA